MSVSVEIGSKVYDLPFRDIDSLRNLASKIAGENVVLYDASDAPIFHDTQLAARASTGEIVHADSLDRPMRQVFLQSRYKSIPVPITTLDTYKTFTRRAAEIYNMPRSSFHMILNGKRVPDRGDEHVFDDFVNKRMLLIQASVPASPNNVTIKGDKKDVVIWQGKTLSQSDLLEEVKRHFYMLPETVVTLKTPSGHVLSGSDFPTDEDVLEINSVTTIANVELGGRAARGKSRVKRSSKSRSRSRSKPRSKSRKPRYTSRSRSRSRSRR